MPATVRAARAAVLVGRTERLGRPRMAPLVPMTHGRVSLTGTCERRPVRRVRQSTLQHLRPLWSATEQEPILLLHSESITTDGARPHVLIKEVTGLELRFEVAVDAMSVGSCGQRRMLPSMSGAIIDNTATNDTGRIGVAGEVVAIHIASTAGVLMRGLASAEAIAGEGLVGDRYRAGTGFYSPTPTAHGARELTLIEEESLAAVLTETGIALAPEEHRRNITTRAIALEPLLGKRFRIGEVVCEGVRSCPPCTHLEDITGKKIMKPLVHRGGIRARIIAGGWIWVGDPIQQT